MRRSVRILIVVVGALVLFGLVVGSLVRSYDWNRAKPWLTATVAHALGRAVKVDGELSLVWHRDATLRGWRAWLPGPIVTASGVTIGNAPWAKAPTLATAQRVDFDLDLLPLLAHRISIPAVRFVDPDVHLERESEQRNNWTFATNDGSPSSWSLDFGRVQFAQGRVAILDRLRQADVRVQLDELHEPVSFAELVEEQEKLSQSEAAERVGQKGAHEVEATTKAVLPKTKARGDPQHYAFAWTADGTLHGKPLHGTGGIGGALALRRPDRPFPLHADVRIGDTRIALIGTLTDPRDLDALDLRLWLSGASLAQLYEVLDIPLPESPPYATKGHLTGRFGEAGTKLHYEEFSARVGDSDLDGDLIYEHRKPRPLLSGKIVSKLLQFRDLAPMIGAKPGGAQQAPASDGKLLPERPFRPERWRVMDADIEFTGDRVFRDSELPIHKMSTHVVMDDAVLSLKPLRFRFAYGDVEGDMRLDGRSAPIKGTITASARGVQLKHLLKTADSAQFDLGNATATVDLNASGNSVGELLGAANGEVKALLEGGRISKALIETAALNVPNMLLLKLTGDKPVEINCATADFVATQGSYEARLFVIDTDTARIDITGHVDLAREKLDLVVHPDSKGLRLLSLRSPIAITGSFSKPEVHVNKGVLLARSVGAIGLAALAAPAALLPLTQASVGQDGNRCAGVLQSMQHQPAPAAAINGGKK